MTIKLLLSLSTFQSWMLFISTFQSSLKEATNPLFMIKSASLPKILCLSSQLLRFAFLCWCLIRQWRKNQRKSKTRRKSLIGSLIACATLWCLSSQSLKTCICSWLSIRFYSCCQFTRLTKKINFEDGKYCNHCTFQYLMRGWLECWSLIESNFLKFTIHWRLWLQ